MLDNVKAVIFDLDGTLVDSMWMWGKIDIEFLGNYGFDVPKDYQDSIAGMSFTETAVYTKERFNLSSSIDEIKDTWNKMAEYKYKNEVKTKDGVINFLKELKKRGIKTGIATSNSTTLVNACLNGNKIQDEFQCIKTSCEVNRGKPFPDIYLAVAKDLGVDPSQCLVFEDIPNGIQAGKSAGMKVCSVYDEAAKHKQDEIKSMSDYFITSYNQILDGSYTVLHPSQ